MSVVTLAGVVVPLASFTLRVSVELTARATAIRGPSGAGKTSLLEAIAGLRRPASGRITINDTVVFDGEENIDIPPRERRIGYAPQDDALFPHLNVRRNLLYGASAGGGSATALSQLTEILEISHLLERGVTELSGGERKRVALARALLRRPQLLLLDEPLSGVHPELRRKVLHDLLRIRTEFDVPLIYVTHELEDARLLCDEIIEIDAGGASLAAESFDDTLPPARETAVEPAPNRAI